MMPANWSMWLNSPIYIGVLGLVIATYFYFRVVALPAGNETMNRIAGYIREGAMAYLFRQYVTLAIYAVIVFVVS